MAITYDAAKGGYTDGATTWSPNSNGVYEIGNLDQLKFFRDAVNDGNSFKGQTVKLTTSIDLNKEEWTPIGKNGAPFQGTFDGQKNTVSNLKITRETSNFAENCGIGFFGYTNAPATITNLTINNVDITGSLYIGAVVGYGFTGKEISSCHVTGDVEIEGWWYIGGIGGNGYVSKVSDCSVVGNEGSYIKAVSYDNEVGSYVGGIWGYRGEGNNTIADCSVDNIDISGMDRIGGICGIAHYVNTIEECSISNSSITADNNIGNVGLIAGANLGNATNGPAILLNNTVDVTTKENFTLEGQVIENPPILGANINTGAPAQAAIIGDVTRNEAGEIVDGTISVVGTEKDSIDVSSKLDLADGLAFYPNSDGTIGVDEAGYVAAIGDTRYTSFENAQAAVKPGETITILTDVDAENISMNGYGLASWNNSKLTATGNIIATTGDNVLSGNVASAQLKLEGSKAKKRTLTITESANVDLYTNGALDGGLLDIGKGLSDEVTTADSGERVYFAHAQIAGDVSVERYDDEGNASSGAIYIRPYSELVVTGNLDVVGEVHNRGSLVVDGGTMNMSVWATPKLLGYDTGDSMTVTNKGTMTVSGASAVTFGEASASLQHMDVVAQYADGMFVTISAGGQFVADTLAFANDEDVTLTVTGEGSLFKLYTDGRTELSYYTYVQNEGKIIIADNAVFDVSGLANDNFVNTGTIDISSATATFATLTNDGTVNFKGGTEFNNTLTGNGTVVYTGEGNKITGGSISSKFFTVGQENPNAVLTTLEISGGAAVEVTGGGNSGRFAPQSHVVITGENTTFTTTNNVTMDETATLEISDGAVVSMGYLATGGKTDVTNATLNLTAASSSIGGLNDSTVFNVNDGGVVNAQAGLYIGHGKTKDGLVNVYKGGELNVSGGALYVSGLHPSYAEQGNGTLNIDGGKVTASNGGDFGLYVGDAWGGASGVLNVTNGGSLTAGFSVQFNATSVVTVDGGEITVNQLYQSEGGELSIVNGGRVTLTSGYFAMGGRITVGDADSGKTSSLTTVAGTEKRPASLGGDYTGHEGETVLNIEKNGEVVLGAGLIIGHRETKNATVNVNEGGRMLVTGGTLYVSGITPNYAVQGNGELNINGGTVEVTGDAGVEIGDKNGVATGVMNINGGDFTAQSVTNYGAVNVTGASTLDAEFMAAGTGLLNLNSVAFGSGTSVNDTASYTNNTIGSEIVMTGTNTLTDGAFVSTGWSKNFRLGYETGTESDSLEITGGATLKVGGNSYIGSNPEDKGAGAYQVTVSGAGSSFAGSGAGGDLYLREDGQLTVKDDASASFSYADIKGSVVLENGNFSFINSRLIGTIAMDYASTLTFSGEINSAGRAITVDMTDFSGGVYKLIDYTGSNSYTEEQYKALLAEGNWNDNFVIINKDLYAANVDTSTLKVNTAWKNTEIGTEVEEGFYYGFNAFDTLSTTIANITNNTTNISIAASDYAGSADAEFTQGVAIDSNGAKFDNMWSFGVNSDTAAEFNPETAEKFTVSGELTVGQFYAEKNANVYVVIDGDLTTVGSFGAKLATQLDLDGSVTVTPPENGAAQVMVYGTMNITGTLDSTSGPMAAVMLIGNDRYDTEYGKGGVLNVTGENASVTLRGNTDSDMPVLISGLSSLNLSDGATFTHENGSIENKGTINVASSTLTVGVALENSGTVNVSGTSTVAAEIDGAVNLLDGADVTFAGGAGDLLVASGAKVTLRGELSGREVISEKDHVYNSEGAQGITVNIASGEGTTFQSYAWYASNGSTYNVKSGSSAQITYANINATGTINVEKDATLTTVMESSNIVGTMNVDGTVNSVMTVYAGYTGGAYSDGAQAGLVNITGTANSSIVTIGTAVRDDDKYNAAAAEGANTTASIVVNGGTFNATGQEGELTSKLFVGSTDYAGTLSAVNGTINVGARSAAGTGYMRFLIGENGTLNLDNSTMTVYNLGGTNNSGEGVFQNSGAINMDVDSQIITATVLANSGTITVDMTDATEFNVYKLIDYTGTGTVTDYGKVELDGKNDYGYVASVLNNDLYLVRKDGATEYYVNSEWSSSNLYDEVTFIDGTKAYYGLNAFDTVDHALTATSYENGIWLNVTGDIGAITVVGKDVTEVNASAKDQIDPETGTVAADAIVVNLVDINNTNAGWQVYYPLASGSDAKVYGDITTNFLSTTFTYEGERTGDPNFSGAGYAGTTATVYGNTTVNIGEVDADDSKLTLNTGFLLGAGGGTVNGDSSLNIYSGTIEAGAVVGGGAWGGLVKGDSSVTISGGEITLGTSTYNAVYGGSYGYANPTSAETRGSASVTIKGDAVVNGKVIGGSDQTAVTGTTVEISGEAQVNGNVYAGGNRGGQVTGNTSVKVNGGTVSGNVFGGGYASDITGTTSLVMTGGTVNGALLGGGEEGNVGDTSIEVSGGTIYSGVAGGGASGTAGNTKVHITGDTQITGDGYGVVLGGGQYIGADVENTSVVIEGNVRITDTWAVEDGGTGLNYGYVYGGGWSGSVNGDTNVVVKGNALVASGVLGGGSWSDSDPYEGSVKGNTYVEIAENAVIGDTHEGYVYGGGWGQNVEGSATVVIKDNATIKHSVVGGGIDSTVASTDVRIEGGTVGKNVYGGGYYNDSTLPVENSDVLGDASVTISGGTVSGNVYAGGFCSNVNGNASVTLSGGTVGGDIYGGSEGSGTVAGSSTLNVGATDAARYTTTLNNVYDFDVANITNAAVTVEGVFSATQISIADSTLTLNSGFDAATTTVSIEVGAYNAENAALVLGSAVGTAPAISISAGSNALTEARYLVATGFDDTTAFSLDESLAGEYILRAVDGNIYLYNADAPYFTTELSVTQAEGASVDSYYSFTANFEAAGLLTGYTLKLYDSATATTPVDEVTLDADVIGQEFTLENTTQSFWISVTANGENGLSTDSPTSGRLEVVVKDYDSPVIQSVSSNVASDAITLTSEATDNFGVTGYEFILDGQSLGVQTGSEIALDLSTLTAGTHSYTVNVYDAAGNLATSAEQSFDFTPGPGPEPGPTEPANFLYSSQVRMNNGETVSVYATYSDAAAALEYRIGDSGEWLTYDATTGVNVSSSTTVYFREQGITDPVETAVDVTVVPADVELNAEVILLAPTTDTTYEVIYNFADGGSKAVELSGNSVEHYALPEDTKITIVEKDASGEVVNTIVEETPAASTTAEIPDKVVAVDDGHDNLFFAMPVGKWTGNRAQHQGDGVWGGTLEVVSLTGKNRFSTVFTGSDDATTLFLTDDANGDAFFLDDIYTANGSDARIRKMSEIQAGAGDDIVDLTSVRYAYEEHASKQLVIRGGDGNDILWGNAGHNIMFGDDGNDKIYGGSDNDVLIGGTGNDTMLGGGGDDIFCYGSSFDWGSDTITQLAGGTVTLYLDGIDRNDCSISGSTLTWNDGTHTGSITLNGVSWDSVKFYCAANGDGDLTKQSDYEELKNKGAFAAISSH